MKKLSFLHTCCCITLLAFMCSCDKGYQVRCTNYSTEEMDSVNIGNNQIIFRNIDRQTASNYAKIKSGTYSIQFVSQSKKRYSSSITIDKNGSGKRSIQIDGTGAISILED